MASLLQCKFIRIYGGKFEDDEIDINKLKEKILIESMRMLGDFAGQYGVALVVENHYHTMTTTAKKTAEIVRAIAHPNVGILYDQANLAYLHAEEYVEAISVQQDFIRYIHAKDFVYRTGNKVFKSVEVSHTNEEDRTYSPRVIGQGIIPWPEIITRLKEFYDGWISMEYTRRWAPKELPDASIGMLEGASLLRRLIQLQ
jgi:L-ribulose-5-phosphate 3-epimerase